jgi:hypothetical protein
MRLSEYEVPALDTNDDYVDYDWNYFVENDGEFIPAIDLDLIFEALLPDYPITEFKTTEGILDVLRKECEVGVTGHYDEKEGYFYFETVNVDKIISKYQLESQRLSQQDQALLQRRLEQWKMN